MALKTPQDNRKKFFLGGWIVDFDFDFDFDFELEGASPGNLNQSVPNRGRCRDRDRDRDRDRNRNRNRNRNPKTLEFEHDYDYDYDNRFAVASLTTTCFPTFSGDQNLTTAVTNSDVKPIFLRSPWKTPHLDLRWTLGDSTFRRQKRG